VLNNAAGLAKAWCCTGDACVAQRHELPSRVICVMRWNRACKQTPSSTSLRHALEREANSDGWSTHASPVQMRRLSQKSLLHPRKTRLKGGFFVGIKIN